jgi:hypothetical protein
MVTTFFIISYQLQKDFFFLSLILLELQKRKNRQMLCEGIAFGIFLRFYNYKSIKDRTFFLLAIDS